jgi:hypothetical protein
MFLCLSLVVGGYGRETEQSEASREGGDGDRGGHPQSTRNGNPSELFNPLVPKRS